MSAPHRRVYRVFAGLSMVGLLGLATARIAAAEKEAESPIPPAQQAADQGAALRLAKSQDLPALQKADRLSIQELWPGKARATVTKEAALKQVRSALVPSEVPPSAGESQYQLSFYAKKQLVREVWVYPEGEWGIQRPKPPHWTTGRNPSLKKLIAAFLSGEKGEGETQHVDR